MMKLNSKRCADWRAKRILPAAFAVALMIPALGVTEVRGDQTSTVVASDTQTGWGGPWSRTEVQRLIVAEAVANDVVPAPLALAVVDAASDFVPRTVGASGALGLMQLHPEVVGRELNAEEDALRDPAANVRLGIIWLARLHEFYDGNWDHALSHFRGGPLAHRDGTFRIHDFTRAYIARVKHCWRYYGSDPLVRAWIQEVGGTSRFGNGEFRPRLDTRSVGRRASSCSEFARKERFCNRACSRYVTVDPCNSSAGAHWPPAHRFGAYSRLKDCGGWSVGQGASGSRYRREGRWVSITGGGGGRFR